MAGGATPPIPIYLANPSTSTETPCGRGRNEPENGRAWFAPAWTPLGLTDKEAAIRNDHNFFAIGRLKPGVTLAQAQAEMNTISQRLEKAYPEDDKGWGAVVNSMREETVGKCPSSFAHYARRRGFRAAHRLRHRRQPLPLARTFARRKEIAIRSAVGATRSRVIQQLLSESLILSLMRQEGRSVCLPPALASNCCSSFLPISCPAWVRSVSTVQYSPSPSGSPS